MTDAIDLSNINQYLPYEFTSCSNLISREETDLIILIRYPTQDEYDKQDIKYPITKIVRHLEGSQSNRPYIATIIYRYFPYILRNLFLIYLYISL